MRFDRVDVVANLSWLDVTLLQGSRDTGSPRVSVVGRGVKVELEVLPNLRGWGILRRFRIAVVDQDAVPRNEVVVFT